VTVATPQDTIDEGTRSSAVPASAAVHRIRSAPERTAASTSQAAAAARSNTRSQLPFWLIALAALAGITWYLLESHGGDAVTEQPRSTAAQRAGRPSANSGMATASLNVGGIDLAKQVNASVGALAQALTGITDVASAEAALPRIQEATAELDGVHALAARLPPDDRQTLAGLTLVAMIPIQQLCDRVLAMPSVAEIAKPALDELRARVDALVKT
jgi:hypothetical protein